MLFLIKKYRNNKKVSLKVLSRLAGYSAGYLNKIENNKKNPSFNALEKIGHALKICPIKLIGGCYGHFCNPNCYYYDSDYSKLPPEARKEIHDFMEYIKEKYREDF